LNGPEVSVTSAIFQSRFDLILKESDILVMPEKAPLLWVLLMI